MIASIDPQESSEGPILDFSSRTLVISLACGHPLGVLATRKKFSLSVVKSVQELYTFA
jgi:hypothetical protein